MSEGVALLAELLVDDERQEDVESRRGDDHDEVVEELRKVVVLLKIFLKRFPSSSPEQARTSGDELAPGLRKFSNLGLFWPF